MDKIDFVLPWVDSSDPQWKELRKQHKLEKNDCHDANAETRFRDMETLRYALRSIEVNCPWYNKIYLITAGHYPDWLDIDHEKIILVSHEELFIDTSHLPVFNSSAIEMNLVNLKGLSEKFVYMNDDFIIWNKIEKKRFFKDDKPVDFFSHHFLPRRKLFELLKGRDTWVHSLNNIINLLNKKFAPITLKKQYLFHNTYTLSEKINNYLFQHLFQRLFWINHWHHPQPLLKNTLKEVCEVFPEKMMSCSQNRFRSNHDLTQYIYRYWQLIHGNFYPYKHNDDLIANIDSYAVLKKLIQILETDESINFVCFNDSTELNNEEYDKVKKWLTAYLENHFPEKASFEI